MEELSRLDVTLLDPNPWNPNRMSEGEFQELVQEVCHLGRVPKPVVVRPLREGRYQVLDGEHAVLAAHRAGLGEVPCEVIHVDDFEAMRQTYKRNQHGRPDPVALGRLFRRMMEEGGLSRRAFARKIDVVEGTVRNYLAYADAADARNRYAPEDGGSTDAEIGSFSVKEVRAYAKLGEQEKADVGWLSTAQLRSYLEQPEDRRAAWLDRLRVESAAPQRVPEPVILPFQLAVDYTCPRCGYGWSGPPRPVGPDVFEPPDEDERPGAVNIPWPNPSLVSPRHMLLRIREEHPDARDLAEEALAALDRYPQGYRCPRCGFEFSGDPGAKREVLAQPES